MDEGSIQWCDIGRDAGIPEGPETESRITIRGMDSYLRNFITLKQKKIKLQEHPGNVTAKEDSSIRIKWYHSFHPRISHPGSSSALY